MSKLRLSLLGSPELEVDDAPAEVDTRKAIALLAYLAVTGRTQGRDHLAGLLWPDYDQERARAALRRTLSTLKRALGGRWVSADRAGLSFDPQDAEIDVLEIRRALAQTTSHAHPEGGGCPTCLATLQDVLAAPKGEFMQGFFLRDGELFEVWQSSEAEAWNRQLAEALEALVRLQAAGGDLDGAITTAERRLALDRLSEATHQHLMQLHAWKGDRAAALHQYRECVAVLDRELGVPPLEETTELYSAIAEGIVGAMEPALLPIPSPQPKPGGAAPGVGLLNELPLVGRDDERAALIGAYEGVAGDGMLVAIEGEAGIGKTRLANELAVHAEKLGSPVVRARCHEGESGLPFAVISEALSSLSLTPASPSIRPSSLAEAARLVPGLGGAEPPPPSEQDPGALTRLYEGLLEVVGAALVHDPPGLLMLDDLHWADRASLDFLAYVCRRLEGMPLCIVATWRPEEIDEASRLNRSAARGTAKGRGVTLVLDRLKADDVRALAAGALPDADAEQIGDALFHETEGVPFFLVEYLATMGRPGASAAIPAGVRELLQTRVELVGAVAKQLLATAAVIDRSFDFETVWRASGRSELEAVDALDELVDHGLFVVVASQDADTPTYRFSHDKLRAFVYEEMSLARRRLLHRRVADALTAISPKQKGVPVLAGPIARHHELGGRENEAATLHADAGRMAAELFANREALDHFMAALALGHSDAGLLHEGMGDMHTLLGDYAKALTSYETAAALSGRDGLAPIERKLGDVYLRRGDWDLAEAHLEASLASDPDAVARAEVLADLSLTAFRKKSVERAAKLAEESLRVATLAQDERALAQAHNVLGMLARARGDLEESVDHLSTSLTLAEQLDEPAAQVAALNNLALAERSRNDLRRAIGLTERALAVCRHRGDRHREAALHNNMADLFHATGDSQEAMDHLKRAAAIFAEVGIEPTGMLPEVWKLVQW